MIEFCYQSSQLIGVVTGLFFMLIIGAWIGFNVAKGKEEVGK